MANLVYCCAVDSESSVTAPVRLEDHALIGAAAVMMPGTTVGKGSTLGAMAASLPGAQLPGGHCAPARPSDCRLLRAPQRYTCAKMMTGTSAHSFHVVHVSVTFAGRLETALAAALCEP